MRSIILSRQATQARFSNVADWVIALRPRHWSKNVFVFAPLLFSGKLGSLPAGLEALAAFVSFCLMASGVYLINDVRDRELDARHPVKRLRPVAAGRIRPGSAVGFAACLVGLATAVAWPLDTHYLAVLWLYLMNNLAYTFGVKERIVADVTSIAIGFMLRLVGGAYAIEVLPSRWLFACGFALSLFLAFGKRRTELTQLAEDSARSRPILRAYDSAKLDVALAVSCAVAIVTYLLFVTAPETIASPRRSALVYTAPVVVYGLIRFMFKAQEGTGAGSVEIVLGDWAFIGAGCVWVAMVLWILYGPSLGMITAAP